MNEWSEVDHSMLGSIVCYGKRSESVLQATFSPACVILGEKLHSLDVDCFSDKNKEVKLDHVRFLLALSFCDSLFVFFHAGQLMAFRKCYPKTWHFGILNILR